MFVSAWSIVASERDIFLVMSDEVPRAEPSNQLSLPLSPTKFQEGIDLL